MRFGGVAAIATLATTFAGMPMAAAQGTDPVAPSVTEPAPDTTSTSTTVLNPSTTTTTVPKPKTTAPRSTTTTTIAPEGGIVDPPSPVTIPPELVGDPRAPILYDPAPNDGGEVPVFQGVFDPGSNQVLEGRVREIQSELLSKQHLLSEMQAQLLELQVRVDALSEELDALSEKSKANIAEAVAAERALNEHTVDAFVNGTSEDHLVMVHTSDPVQMGVARELLGSVVESDAALLERNEKAQARLDDRQEKLLAELTEAQGRYNELNTLLIATLADAASEGLALQAYENGAQVYVKGFVFPVQGEVEFIDSWGYPRMTGTASAHWHQGTDIFAPMGTPLVAAESGEVFKVGVASLGGNRVWVRGDSGTEYYYAHLSAYAEGISDGLRVNAGDVVGYVGDTGNAKGTSPHLHFEVHPNGGDAVNPYPLLKATYGNRPMVEIVEAPPPLPAAVDPITGQPIQDPLTTLAQPAGEAPQTQLGGG